MRTLLLAALLLAGCGPAFTLDPSAGEPPPDAAPLLSVRDPVVGVVPEAPDAATETRVSVADPPADAGAAPEAAPEAAPPAATDASTCAPLRRDQACAGVCGIFEPDLCGGGYTCDACPKPEAGACVDDECPACVLGAPCCTARGTCSCAEGAGVCD
jgi:hypothetical protein